MDSIRENECLEDMITTLKAELDADIDNCLSIALVEGSDDQKFISHIFDRDVICYESFSGKHGLTQLIEAEELQQNRIIAIRDRDYANESDFPDRMFCYDTCCLETMLLSNEDVVTGILDIYYKGCLDKSLILTKIMRELAPLSVLRQNNEQRTLGIDFARVRIAPGVDEERVVLYPEQIFSKIEQDDMSLEDCQNEAMNVQDEELPEKTNGHDICQFLGKILKAKKGDLGEERVRDLLICGYRKSDFQKTQLYVKLKSYQTQYHTRYVD